MLAGAYVELWSWSRTAEALARLQAHAERLATRLGKAVRVTVEHNDLRMPRARTSRSAALS
jgi:hypothetical protein